jgi:uncharacterized protein
VCNGSADRDVREVNFRSLAPSAPSVASEDAREDGEVVSHARTAEYAVEHDSSHGGNRLVYAVAMTPPLEPLRLSPGADLRAALQVALAERGVQAACVVTGIGSLRPARLRLAGAQDAFEIEGDSEILTLAGTLSPDGPHLHMSVADAQGGVVGGHVLPGCVVRTTASA